MEKEKVFKSLLYLLLLPYLIYTSYIHQNTTVLICGVSILTTHLYKDIFNPTWIYPTIIKRLGTLCAGLIVIYGDTNYVKMIGFAKLIGDFRKYMFHNDKYYF
jgi:hypothetical protein